LHIEGEPYERGYQHGRLLAPEIAGYVRCSAALQSHLAPADGWKHTRGLVNALFLRRYDKEYLEEMKGIADGAAAAGACFEGRPIDLVDVVALNAWPEIDTLSSALEATPTGLEGIRFAHQQPRAMPEAKDMHCSAFAATGPATVDGKVVFGHITMFGLYPSLFYNVWLDIKPAKGHRVLMQSYPGGIQSGMDYYLNDAGLLVCETTIDQTRFDIQGLALGSRIRQALQYADTIDAAVESLKKANNGLYTNEWLLADIKTNEIAMFELGTAKTKLYRSSKNEWFGGTPGFYWGCNNTKNLEVRLETIPSVKAEPANMVWRPSNRDRAWQRLYAEYKGKINADFGKIAFTTPPLAGFHSLDAKFTTTDLAKDLKTWALFGPPLGRTWEPSQEERQRYPEVRPMVSNPWTVLHTQPPTRKADGGLVVHDLPGSVEAEDKEDKEETKKKKRSSSHQPAWHGTILPVSDSDVWLAVGFAEYQKIVADEQRMRREAGVDRERLAAALFAHRSRYALAVRARPEESLQGTRAESDHSAWYDAATGKGVLVLHELRRWLGDEVFLKMMEAFGQEHAGREVTVADFQKHIAKSSGKTVDHFFAYWTTQLGLPSLRLGGVTAVEHDNKYRVEGDIERDGLSPPQRVDVTVETTKGNVTRHVFLDASRNHFQIDMDQRPQRLIVDKYARSAKANGGPFSVTSFDAELKQTLIVYGTSDELFSHMEAAHELQKAIIRSGPNITVPVKTDREVTEEELRTNHIILIGRPDSNRCMNRFRSAFPITFGSRSFTVDKSVYAHPNSAVAAAAPNPLDPRYSIVVLAGLSAKSTRQSATHLMGHGDAGEVLVLPAGKTARALVMPARELVRDLVIEGDKGKATQSGARKSEGP
jgi:hypothetical protein